MRQGLKALAATAALGVLAIAGTPSSQAQEVVAYGEGTPELDYDAYFTGLAGQKDLAEKCLQLAKDLHEVMDKIRTSDGNPEDDRVLRAKAKSILQTYREYKKQQVELIDASLATAPPRMSDRKILHRLRDTELLGIVWNKRKFIDCLRDVGTRLKVNFVMHPNVLKFNTVEMDFPRASADSVLRTICSGFECDYIVYNGEIIVIKSIKRNDERLNRYLKEHPEWKYWRPEKKVDIGTEDEDL
ncbi:MAG: hypothetical protein ACYTG4_09375 [Planctomycetota bacterium]